MEANFRDDLAKRAMASLIEAGSCIDLSIGQRIRRFFGILNADAYDFYAPNHKFLAQQAYKYADAMIAERNKESE